MSYQNPDRDMSPDVRPNPTSCQAAPAGSHEEAARKAVETHKQRMALIARIGSMHFESPAHVLDFGLECSLELTGSEIGYIYRYNVATRRFSLFSWSKNVMDACRITEKKSVYDLDATGCWGDVVRTGRPMVINDYPGHPGKRGIPEGHVPLRNFMTVPVHRAGDIVAVFGVANKPAAYDDFDLLQLSLLSENIWTFHEKLEAMEKLREADRLAEQAAFLKAEFLGNISHEIRTPLNGIMGMLQLARETNDPAEIKGCVALAHDACRQLNMLLSDLLNFSKLASGMDTLSLAPFSLVGCAREVATMMQAKAAPQGVGVACLVDPGVAPDIVSDEIKVRQILLNLLDNAVKFSRGGEVRLRVWSAPSPAGQGSARVYASVEDSGRGIPDEKMPIIFESFRQAEPGYTRTHGGVGLGLSIVRQLASRLGGDVCLCSEPGVGTVAVLWFDARPAEAGLPAEKPRPLREAAGTARAVRVLVAEDDRVNQLVFRKLLSKLGCQVDLAGDGEEALAALARGPSFDLVFMDIQMPCMDGIAAMQAIRLRRDLAGLPVVALTAHSMQGDKEKFLSLGFTDYLSKPLEEADLLAMVRKHVPAA